MTDEELQQLSALTSADFVGILRQNASEDPDPGAAAIQRLIADRLEALSAENERLKGEVEESELTRETYSKAWADERRRHDETLVLLAAERQAHTKTKRQLAETHDDTCENEHAKHEDCTEACSCVGSGKSAVERVQHRVWELEEQLEAERRAHAETQKALVELSSIAPCATFDPIQPLMFVQQAIRHLRARHAADLAAAEERAIRWVWVNSVLATVRDVTLNETLARYRATQEHR